MNTLTPSVAQRPVLPKWLRPIAVLLARFFYYGVLWLVYAIGLFYNARLFMTLKADTTAITNTAFVIAATLAALLFTWCQAMPGEDPHRPVVLYAGERLLESSLALLLASLLKYAGRSIEPAVDFRFFPSLGSLVRGGLGLLAATFFFSALLSSFIGLRLALPAVAARTRPEVDFG